MKTTFFILFLVSASLASEVFSQPLPPAAQALYDSAYAQDSALVKDALSKGAKVLASPDGKSFYLRWFPTGKTPASTPVIVTLHGSHCNAFMEFKSWYPRANVHGCGILALQWYRYQPNPPNDYFPDDTLYSYLDSALTRFNYPSGKALLHGFSRGAARSYALLFKDMRGGKNYFCTTIANSGDADTNYPLYDSITKGLHGLNVFAGKRWNLFCGAKDTITGCPKMAATKTWLQSQGATVDIFIQDANLDHDGFQLPASFAYKDSVLDNYLLCYNGTLSVNEKVKENELLVFPNPFDEFISITGGKSSHTFFLVNTLGQTVIQWKGSEEKKDVSRLSPGFYFLNIQDSGGIVGNWKMVKE